MSDRFIDPSALAAFDAATMAKANLCRGERMFVGLNCFEPGQTQRVHTHADADKFYLVLSGKARMVVGDETRDVTAGMLVWAPAGAPHGVEEALERTVMVVAMAAGARAG